MFLILSLIQFLFSTLWRTRSFSLTWAVPLRSWNHLLINKVATKWEKLESKMIFFLHHSAVCFNRSGFVAVTRFQRSPVLTWAEEKRVTWWRHSVNATSPATFILPAPQRPQTSPQLNHLLSSCCFSRPPKKFHSQPPPPLFLLFLLPPPSPTSGTRVHISSSIIIPQK